MVEGQPLMDFARVLGVSEKRVRKAMAETGIDLVWPGGMAQPPLDPAAFEAMRIDRGWPTPTSMRSAADALDKLAIPRYGDVLRWMADACDGLGAASEHPEAPVSSPAPTPRVDWRDLARSLEAAGFNGDDRRGQSARVIEVGRAIAVVREAAAAPLEPDVATSPSPRPDPWQKCPVCDGKGRYMPLHPLPVTDPYVQCNACGGRGMVRADSGTAQPPLDVALHAELRRLKAHGGYDDTTIAAIGSFLDDLGAASERPETDFEDRMGAAFYAVTNIEGATAAPLEPPRPQYAATVPTCLASRHTVEGDPGCICFGAAPLEPPRPDLREVIDHEERRLVRLAVKHGDVGPGSVGLLIDITNVHGSFEAIRRGLAEDGTAQPLDVDRLAAALRQVKPTAMVSLDPSRQLAEAVAREYERLGTASERPDPDWAKSVVGSPHDESFRLPDQDEG